MAKTKKVVSGRSTEEIEDIIDDLVGVLDACATSVKESQLKRLANNEVPTIDDVQLINEIIKSLVQIKRYSGDEDTGSKDRYPMISEEKFKERLAKLEGKTL
jgi:hypothetical protein